MMNMTDHVMSTWWHTWGRPTNLFFSF